MYKIILITLMALGFNNLDAQEIGRPAKYKRDKILEEFFAGTRFENASPYGKDVTNENTGITDIEIIFEDQNKRIFFRNVNLDNFIVLKGEKKLPKYLKHYIDDYKIILVPLEADYIIKYKNFIIESNNKKLYLNNDEVELNVIINENNKIISGSIMYWEEPPRIVKKQSLTCLNKKLKIDAKNKHEIFESRRGIELIKINYGQNGLYPMVDFNFTDQVKYIFFESLDIENLKLIKGDAKQYPKYINRHRGYHITHFELKGDYLLKNDKYTIQSKGNQLFINNQEVCTNVVIGKDGKMNFNVYDDREQEGRL